MASKRSDAQKNRAHLLLVARHMVEEGADEPSFNELARRAGVGVGTVYRHFAGQRELLVALVEDQLAALQALMEQARETTDAWEGLEQLFRGALALELESPVIAQLLSSPRRESSEVQARVSALEASAEAIVNRARRAKVIRPGLKAGDFRRLICGLERAVRAGDEPETSARRYVDLLLAGLKA